MTSYSHIQVLLSEGIRGLYRGYGATVAREVLGNGAWFGTYEFVRSVRLLLAMLVSADMSRLSSLKAAHGTTSLRWGAW